MLHIVDELAGEPGLELVLIPERQQPHSRNRIFGIGGGPRLKPCPLGLPLALDRRVGEPAAAPEGIPRTRARSSAAGLGATRARRLPLLLRHGRAEARAAGLVVVLALAGEEAAARIDSTATPEATAIAEPPSAATPRTGGCHGSFDPAETGSNRPSERARFLAGVHEMRRRGLEEMEGGSPKSAGSRHIYRMGGLFMGRDFFWVSTQADYLGRPV